MGLRHWLSAATLIATGSAWCGGDADSGSPVIIGHRHVVHSDVLGEARPVFIRVPDHYDESDARYPALYVVEADESRFHDVTAAARTLARQGSIPQLVVVAVPTENRNRDLTPPLSNPDAAAPASAGGAGRFLSFLTEELVQFVDRKFRTTSHRTISGVSFGGLFTVYALAQAPCAFDAYVAISPSLWWDDRALTRDLGKIVRHACAETDRLVFTIANEGPRMREPLEQSAALLNAMAPDTFQWQIVEVPGETHDTTASPATYVGLRAAFGDWAIDDKAVDSADSLERLYLRRSARYGVSPAVPAGGYFQAGWRLHGDDHAEQARELFLRALAVDPEYTLAVAGLGLALQQMGDIEEARRQLRRAVELAQRDSHPMLPQIRDALAGIEAVSASDEVDD